MPKLPAVYKRPGSPLYWGSVMVNGNRRQYALTENKAISQRMLHEIKEDRKELGKYGNVSWLAFKDKFVEWARANKNKKTVDRDILTMEYLEEFMHPRELIDVTAMALEDFKTWLINRSERTKPTGRRKYIKARGVMGPQGINRVISSAKAFMRKAEDWDLIPPQKWKMIKKLKTPQGRITYFTPEEIAIIINHASALDLDRPIDRRPPWLTVTLLGARAGLRRAEMHNLTWQDIDFSRKILSVTPKRDWHPKDYECRDIPMPDDLVEHLRNLPRRGPYVIYDRYGERLAVNTYTGYYGREIKKCGLTGNIHKLRHTYASHLVQNGVDLYTVSKLLGHSTIKTTEIYAHLGDNTFFTAIRKLPDIKVL